MWNRGRRGSGKNRLRAGPCLLPSQKKLIEPQAGKKSLEDQVEVLRTLKEEAEKPEEAAKDQHRRLWEGTSLHPAWLRCPLGSCQGRVWAQESLAHCLLSVVPLVFFKSRPFSSPVASLSSTVCWALCLKVIYSSNLQL